MIETTGRTKRKEKRGEVGIMEFRVTGNEAKREGEKLS